MNSSDSDENEEYETLTLKVTKSQKVAVKEFFEKQHWEFIEIQGDDDTSLKHVCSEDTEDFDISTATPGYTIKQNETEDECPFCLCRPCITDDSNRQLWWKHEPSQPHPLNSKSRKKCYKHFWTMLYHRQVWQDPRY
jgi:hypothetical protein